MIIENADGKGDLYKIYKDELNCSLNDLGYKWTKEKSLSCDWIIARLPNGVGVDVGGTLYIIESAKNKFKNIDITYFDLFPPSESCGSEVSYIQSDMSFFANYFDRSSLDFITCRHTLEHSTDPLFVLWQFNRCLKDDGLLFVVLPCHTKWWVWFYSHFNCLPLDNWWMLFHRAGFEIIESDAGTWNKKNPQFIEYRFVLRVNHRGIRLTNNNIQV